MTRDLQWETSGPWQVSMSYATARSIALRVGPYEFQPPTSHPAPRDVPCDAALTVALAGANAWTHWHSERGSLTAGWTGYATGPSYGRFDCTGTKRRDDGAVETCTHQADKHAGEITVRFTITSVDPPFLVPWRSIGLISLGEPRAKVESDYGFPGGQYHVLARTKGILQGYYRLHNARVYVTFQQGVVNELAFSTPYYRTRDGFGVGSTMPNARIWHGFVYNAWHRGKPCDCWVKVGLGQRSLAATPANFQKPWFFIYTKHGRVARFFFALRFVD